MSRLSAFLIFTLGGCYSLNVQNVQFLCAVHLSCKRFDVFSVNAIEVVMYQSSDA